MPKKKTLKLTSPETIRFKRGPQLGEVHIYGMRDDNHALVFKKLEEWIEKYGDHSVYGRMPTDTPA